MNRRTFMAGLGAVLAAPGAIEGQQAGRVRRIGNLAGGGATSVPTLSTFRSALQDLGWREGENVTIEHRAAEGNYDRFSHFAAELVRLPVDVIVVGPTPAAIAARTATTTIPIVMAAVADPVGSGLVASLARPGGNVTGVSSLAGGETIGKYLELLKAAASRISRVAVLWNPRQPSHGSMLTQVQTAARSMNCDVRLVAASSPDELEDAFGKVVQDRGNALLVLPDSMFLQQRVRLAELALKSQLPAVYGARQHAEAGGLMAYAASLHELYRRAAVYVDRIFRGAKPADLPVEQPTKFELIINLKTAKALGLTIPRSLLLRADQVIE